MTDSDDSAGRQWPGPEYPRPHGGTGYDAYGRPIHPGWAGQPSPYDRPRPPKVPLPHAPVWLPMAVVGVGVVAAFLATLNRPGLGLVITGLVAGLTALAALMVRPAIPESGVPSEASPEEGVAPSTAPPRGRAVAESGTDPRVHATIPPDPAREGRAAPQDGTATNDGSPESEDGERFHADTPDSEGDDGRPAEATATSEAGEDPSNHPAAHDENPSAPGARPHPEPQEPYNPSSATPEHSAEPDHGVDPEHSAAPGSPGTSEDTSNHPAANNGNTATPETHPHPEPQGTHDPSSRAPEGAEPEHSAAHGTSEDDSNHPAAHDENPSAPGAHPHPEPQGAHDPSSATPGYAPPAQQGHTAPAPQGHSASGHQGYPEYAHPGYATPAPFGYPGHPGHRYPGHPELAPVAYAPGHPGHSRYPGYADHPGYAGHTAPAAPAEPARPDRFAYTWSAVFGVLAAVLLATAALRDAGWVLVWTLTGSFLLASMAFATRNPAARRNAVGVATGAFALMRNLPATPRFLLSPLNTKRTSGLALPIIVTSMVTVGLLLVFGLLFALADPVFATYLGRMFTSIGTGSGFLRLFGMLVTMLLTGAAVLTARRHHRPRPRPAAPAADPIWPVWVWTVPLIALVALFVAFVGVQAAVMFGGDDYVQRVSGVIYAEYARQGFFQLVVVSALVLGVIAVAVRVLPSRATSTLTLRNALLGLLCVLTLIILASAMMRLQLYIDTFGLTRLRVSAEAWILWSAGVFGLVIVAGLCNTLGRSAAWLPRLTVAFGAVALAVFAYGNPDLRIAQSHHDLDLAAVDTDYLSTLSADAVPGLMGLSEHDRTCALVGLRDRLDDPDGRGVAAWNLSRVQGRQQLAELGLFNDVSGLDCGVRDYVDW